MSVFDKFVKLFRKNRVTFEQDSPVMVLPGGSAFTTISMELPKDHWLYEHQGAETYAPPPMGLRMGRSNTQRRETVDKVKQAAKYAVRATTYDGQCDDFDPDALVQNMVVGLLGYFTSDGLSCDDWANPKNIPPEVKITEII